MSEHQYYEFLAVDRPLDAAAQAELRAISSRARISSTSFVNSYDWGDLKANPLELLERHFDAFLYLANWGTRRLVLRLPRKHFDPKSVGRFGLGDLIDVRASGSHVILDIERNEEEPEDWGDGSGWLASLAPLRADLLAGDLGLFHLLWLIETETGATEGDATEPMPNPGPLSAPLAALAEFLGTDSDLLAAAYGTGPSARREAPDLDRLRAAIAEMPDADKVDYLIRLHEGNDPHLGLDLRKRCRARAAPALSGLRSACERLKSYGSRPLSSATSACARKKNVPLRSAGGAGRRKRKPAPCA